jgi:hypothetical protein
MHLLPYSYQPLAKEKTCLQEIHCQCELLYEYKLSECGYFGYPDLLEIVISVSLKITGLIALIFCLKRKSRLMKKPWESG